MICCMPMKIRYFRSIFWLQWSIIAVLTGTLMGPLSPFLVSNLIVYTLGWNKLRGLTSGGEYSNYILICAFSFLIGLIIGAIESIMLQHELSVASVLLKGYALLAFSVDALLTTLTFLLFSGGLYTAYYPFCGLALIVWGFGLLLPLALPIAFRFFK
jgi:hypothetical protein